MSTVDLRLGDCLELMRGIPDNSIDAVITDPPYNYGKEYGTHDDSMSQQDFETWLRIRFQEIARVLKDGGVVYFTCSTQMMHVCENWEFLRFRQWLIWHRPNIINPSAQSDWKQDWEPIYYGGKGSFRAKKGIFPDTALIRMPAPQSNFSDKRVHVCQRPVGLIVRILMRVECETVLDPFMGSGTTGIACLKLGKSFIGYENDPDSFAKAQKRIADAQTQPGFALDAEYEQDALFSVEKRAAKRSETRVKRA